MVLSGFFIILLTRKRPDGKEMKAELQQEWTWRTMALKGCVQSRLDVTMHSGKEWLTGWGESWYWNVYLLYNYTENHKVFNASFCGSDWSYWDVASVYLYCLRFMVGFVIDFESNASKNLMLWVVGRLLFVEYYCETICKVVGRRFVKYKGKHFMGFVCSRVSNGKCRTSIENGMLDAQK